MTRVRKRPKDAPTFVTSIPLEVTMAQAREITARFEVARQFYNVCLNEALKRAQQMRADPRWLQAKAMSRNDLRA